MDALRAVGAFVVYVSGPNAPDLLVCYRGRWTPLEAKSRKGTVRDGQAAAGYPIVRSVDEALQAIGVAAHQEPASDALPQTFTTCK